MPDVSFSPIGDAAVLAALLLSLWRAGQQKKASVATLLLTPGRGVANPSSGSCLKREGRPTVDRPSWSSWSAYPYSDGNASTASAMRRPLRWSYARVVRMSLCPTMSATVAMSMFWSNR